MNDLQKQTARAIVNIFETGKVRGDYGALAVLKGDKGHLSYGRSQTTLGSGGLYQLLDLYCKQSNAKFAGDLTPQLQRFQQKDFSLDTDSAVKSILEKAGHEDPVMQAVQDQFFNDNFMVPTCQDAEAFGVQLPLGQAIVYDSHIQGGWGTLKARIGPVNARGEEDWISKYIDLRKAWLQSLNPPLPGTVYRMDSFRAISDQKNFQLTLPLSVRGVAITEDALQGPALSQNGTGSPRMLKLTSPYMKGDDVKALQQALLSKVADLRTALKAPTLNVTVDGVYGPFTDTLVKVWQAGKDCAKEDGVGPLTRQSLGI